MPIRPLTILFTVISISFAACGGGESSSSSYDYPPPATNYQFTYSVDNSAFFEDIQWLEQLGQSLSEDLNKTLRLPHRDINLHFRDCGIENAFYSPSDSEITMCNELFFDIVSEYDNEDSSLVYSAIFLHELGHALIDQMELPVLGKNEDAADTIAAILAMDAFAETGDDASKGAASIFLLGDYLFSDEDLFWGGVHSIGPVRQANLICWSVGGYPNLLIVEEVNDLYMLYGLDTRDCASEYHEANLSFYQLLGDYIK